MIMPHMTYAPYIRELGRGAKGADPFRAIRPNRSSATCSMAKVPPLELGAILIALRIKSRIDR